MDFAGLAVFFLGGEGEGDGNSWGYPKTDLSNSYIK